MSHRNARLTPAGRRILVERIESGRPAAHVAKEMGVSRTCAHRWHRRYRDQGWQGLEDRSSKPHSSPRATSPEVVEQVLKQRAEYREGPFDLGARCRVHPRTVSRILARAGAPKLWELDPVTGDRIRAGRATGHRYEREAPGDLLHVDVKKLGRIPDGGGWRALGRDATVATKHKKEPIGFDYVHVAVDDHSRLAYAEVLTDEKGTTCAGFLTRAAAFMAAHGAPVKRVMTDNAFAYRNSRDFQGVLQELGAKHKLIKPRSPWQNGKAERFNRTLQEGWAYRRPYTSNRERAEALTGWLNFYNHHRAHSALEGRSPISRCQQPAV